MSILYRHPLLRTLVGSVLLTAGLGFLIFIVVNLATDLSVWVLGQRTNAEVVAAWVEETSEENATEPTLPTLPTTGSMTPVSCLSWRVPMSR